MCSMYNSRVITVLFVVPIQSAKLLLLLLLLQLLQAIVVVIIIIIIIVVALAYISRLYLH